MSRSVLAGIPANIIVGAARARRRLLRHLLSVRAPGERWAVLDNDAAGPGVGEGAPQTEVAELADDCICCSAVGTRVALTRLLRRARPQRLLVLPSAQARIPELLRLLSDRWLAPVLALRAAVAVVDAVDAAGSAMARDTAGDSPLASMQIVAVDVEGATEARIAAARAALAAAAPRARIVLIRDGALDAALLDQPGPVVRPRFASGGDRD